VLPKLVVVREVAVIYHLHHNMFYHMVQDQYYRLLALLPYLRQHPDIHILIYGWSDSKNWDGTFGDRFFQFCGISKYPPLFLLLVNLVCLIIAVSCVSCRVKVTSHFFRR